MEALLNTIRTRNKKYGLEQPAKTPEMVEHMKLLRILCSNPSVVAAFDEAVKNANGCTSQETTPNPWKDATIGNLIEYMDHWFNDLPHPMDEFGFILPFTWFYNDNKSGYYFVNGFQSKSGSSSTFTTEIFDWLCKFVVIRGEFMDMSASLPVELFEAWKKHPSISIDDFLVPCGGFKSYNDLFTRQLHPERNPRPVDSLFDHAILVSPADSTVNVIDSDITVDTKICIKGGPRYLSVRKLLGGHHCASRFVGGTAISCVLKPTSYHHYHAPVSGHIIASKDIPGIYFGIQDGKSWFNDMSNLGRGDTDFSIFEEFHRAHYIIDTGYYGLVAVVVVGLNTISKIHNTLQGKSEYFIGNNGNKQKKSLYVEKGTRLGGFAYGGSLVILLIEKGSFPCSSFEPKKNGGPCISLQVGNRLGRLNRIN